MTSRNSFKTILKEGKDYDTGADVRVSSYIPRGAKVFTSLDIYVFYNLSIKKIKIMDGGIYEKLFYGVEKDMIRMNFFIIFYYSGKLYEMTGKGFVSDDIDSGTTFVISQSYIMEWIGNSSSYPTQSLITQYRNIQGLSQSYQGIVISYLD